MKSLNRFFLHGFLVATLLTSLPALSHAIGFNIDWTGSGGYTMTGMFSYSDALINTGFINETQIDTLMIDVLFNGVSQGTWDLADGQDAGAIAFNFNFNTTAEAFRVGGNSSSGTGQIWNAAQNSSVGFGSGSFTQDVFVNGVRLGTTSNFASLTATRKQTAPVPEPSTLLLFGSGMLGLLGYATRRKRQAQAAA